ncbi:vascular endothelial growth factor A, long form isoform X1 [Ochotona princeps]|uniref:vascular endothelial growth factor A, long form isoform X1 n=1 Tax=Ochotona princeps TaxID=9978 RepID=UPI00271469D2|nr:vascular endothelial growth factor A, long form isoform X1 [Ochotona princeps]
MLFPLRALGPPPSPPPIPAVSNPWVPSGRSPWVGCPIWVWLAGSLIVVCTSFPQIMRIKPHQGQHIGEMSFLQHNKCECRPKKDRARQEKKSVRGKGKGQKRKRKKSRYKSWSAPCGPCSERRKHLFVQDPQTCKCSCKNTDSRCKARQLELNERTCRCDKPRR